MPDKIYNRWTPESDWDSVLFRPGVILQCSELNESQSILSYKSAELGRTIFKEGEVITGCSPVIEDDAPNVVKITDGKIFIGGAVRYVAGTQAPHLMITGYGEEKIGLVERNITVMAKDDGSNLENIEIDPSLFNPVESIERDSQHGLPGGGQEGAYRSKRSYWWAASNSWKIISTWAVNQHPRIIINRNVNDLLAFKLNLGTQYERTETIRLNSGERSIEDIIAELNTYTYLKASVEQNHFVITGALGDMGTIELGEIENNAYEALKIDHLLKMINVYDFLNGMQRVYQEPSQFSKIYDKIAKERYELEGNFVVKDFSVRIEPCPDNPNNVWYKILSGIAFVKGYRTETLAPVVIEVPKGRTIMNATAENKIATFSEKLLPLDFSNVAYINRSDDPSGNKVITNVLDHKSLYAGSTDLGDAGATKGIQCFSAARPVWSPQWQRYVHGDGPRAGLPIQKGDANVEFYTWNSDYRLVGNKIEWLIKQPLGTICIVWERACELVKGYRTLKTRNAAIQHRGTKINAPVSLSARVLGDEGTVPCRYGVMAHIGSTGTELTVMEEPINIPANPNPDNRVVLEWSAVPDATHYSIWIVSKDTLGNEKASQIIFTTDTTWHHKENITTAHQALLLGSIINNTNLADKLPDKNVTDILKIQDNVSNGKIYTPGGDFSLFTGAFPNFLSPACVIWKNAESVRQGTNLMVGYQYWEPYKPASIESNSFESIEVPKGQTHRMTINLDGNDSHSIEFINGVWPITQIIRHINQTVKKEIAFLTWDNRIRLQHNGSIGLNFIPPFNMLALLGFPVTEVQPMEDTVGDFCCIDSYSDYDLVPTHLRDSIDLREMDKELSLTHHAESGTSVATISVSGYSYFKGRIDCLYLDEYGRFFTVQGNPSAKQKPDMPRQYCSIAYITVPSYGYGTAEYKIDVIPQKVYQQKDIKAIEERVEVLEYLNTLDLLNQTALNEDTPDYAKQGIMVNPFTGVSRIDYNFEGKIKILNYEDPDKPDATKEQDLIIPGNYAIDPPNKHLLLPFEQTREVLSVEPQEKVVTLDYVANDLPSISQSAATDWVNVAPFVVFSYSGRIKLTPSNDVRFDTEYAPELRSNFEGERSQWDGSPLGFETEWNNWNVISNSVSTETKTSNAQATAQTTATDSASTTATSNKTNTTTTTNSSSGNKTTSTSGSNSTADWSLSTSTATNTTAKTQTTTSTQATSSVGANITSSVDINTALSVSLIATTQTTVEQRSGNQLQMMPEAITEKIGDNIVDLSVLPYIQPRGPLSVEASKLNSAPPIVIEAWGLRPNMGVPGSEAENDTLTFTIGGQKVPVTRYGWTPEGSTWAASDADLTDKYIDKAGEDRNGFIKTDETGYTLFQADIPKGALQCGTHEVKLTGWETDAQGTYAGQGFLRTRQEQYITVDAVNLTTTTKTDTRTNTNTSYDVDTALSQQLGSSIDLGLSSSLAVNTSTTTNTNVVTNTTTNVTGSVSTRNSVASSEVDNADPMAQTFFTGDTVFQLIKVALYFKRKPGKANEQVPVQVQIRNVINGYPGQNVIAYKFLDVDEINISSIGDEPTFFEFDNPVVLMPNSEYALMVKAVSDQYEVFVSKVGSYDLKTGNRVISRRYLGVFFTSPNASSWSMDLETELKFDLYEASYKAGKLPNEPGKTVEWTSAEYDNEISVICPAMTQELQLDTAVHHYYSIDKENFDSPRKKWCPCLSGINIELDQPTKHVDFRSDLIGTRRTTPLVSGERTNITGIRYKDTGYMLQYPIILGKDIDGIDIEYDRVRVDYQAMLEGDHYFDVFWSPDGYRYIQLGIESTARYDRQWVDYRCASRANGIGSRQASTLSPGERIGTLTGTGILQTNFIPYDGEPIVLEYWDDDKKEWVLFPYEAVNEKEADPSGTQVIWRWTPGEQGADIIFGDGLVAGYLDRQFRAFYDFSNENIISNCYVLAIYGRKGTHTTPRIRNMRSYVLGSLV